MEEYLRKIGQLTNINTNGKELIENKDIYPVITTTIIPQGIN